MNDFLYEMLGRQRFEEMLREAAKRGGQPTMTSWHPVGRVLIQVGRRLERMGEHLTVKRTGDTRTVGGLR